jgi:hypothetical protein
MAIFCLTYTVRPRSTDILAVQSVQSVSATDTRPAMVTYQYCGIVFMIIMRFVFWIVLIQQNRVDYSPFINQMSVILNVACKQDGVSFTIVH